MANFSLFETFFFLTLAITFILILLLVYHFKDRLSKLEQKSDSMFEIIQNLHGTFSEELANLKSTGTNVGGGNNSIILGPSLDPYNIPQNDSIDIEEFDIRKIEHIDLSLEEDSDEEDSDEEEMNDDEEDSGDEEEEDDVDNEEDGDDDEEEEESDDGTTIERINVPTMESDTDFKKLSVPQLRELVLSKGLSNSVSKLKKGELITLLSQ